MSGIDTAHLVYLIVLLLMVLGWFFAQRRQSMNRLLQQATVWGLIFLGTIAAIGLWDDIAQTVIPGQVSFEGEGRIVAPRRADGHYYLVAQVNGAPVRFVVDTGATDMVLTRRDAEKAGLDLQELAFVGSAMTANGIVRTATVRLDSVVLGGVRDTDMRAVVNDGDMSQSLLGMGYLQHWGRIEIAGNELILTR